MDTPEIWEYIPGYDFKYKISNKGHVSSKMPDGEYKGRKLNKCTPYLSFSVVNKEKNLPQTCLYVHKIVAQVFLGKKPEGMVICHIDGNRYNNSAANLKYAYPEENAKDTILHCIHKGSKNGRSKLDEKDAKVIKNLLKENISLSAIARSFEVSVSAINLIHKNKNWKHVS